MDGSALTPVLRTERLILREWRDSDKIPFAELNANSEVMQFMPKHLSRDESDALVQRIEDHFAQNGFGLWAVEILGGGPFIGFVGLSIPRFRTSFTPCVEIGWRLARHAWGNGYATEAAHRALRFGFAELELSEIVSFTVPHNLRSRRVMERLGMRHNPAEDFDHPLLAETDPLRRHVLYRLAKPEKSDKS